eukprot:362154-Chlamydomonas_euryale.AAC.7
MQTHALCLPPHDDGRGCTACPRPCMFAFMLARMTAGHQCAHFLTAPHSPVPLTVHVPVALAFPDAIIFTSSAA